MANTHLAYPDLALDKFSGTDPDQDAESFVQLIERKINFALGDAPADPDDLVSYTFRKKALFSSLLRGPAAEWYENNIENATTWADTREQFITRFSDGRNKFRHRMEVEHCVRGDGEEIRNFLHRIKKIVDKGWPDDMEGIVEADRAAERQAQGRQRRQRYIDYTLRGLRPRYLQRKAQEYLMEHPNATWNDFSTRIIQRDVSYQVSSNFLNDEEQTKVQLASLGQEMKNLQSELQEHRVSALENPRQPDPNQKGRQNATRFCNYCRSNGHTQNWCRRRIRDEEIRRVQYDMSHQRNVAPIWDCGTISFNRESQYGQNRDRPLDWNDGNNPTNGLLTTEGEAWQDGSNEVVPNEPRFISRADGINFNLAHFTSTGESDDEVSDQLPLGY